MINRNSGPSSGPRALFARSTLHDSTAAIERAVCASANSYPEALILCWDKRGVTGSAHDSFLGHRVLRLIRPVPPRSARAVIARMIFGAWVGTWIVKYRPTMVQALDLESALPAAILRRLLRFHLVYDMRDPFADCFRFPGPLRAAAYGLDWLVMSQATAFVVPTRERCAYLGRWGRTRPVRVMPNTCKDETELLPAQSPVSSQARPGSIRIAFLGYLNESRGLTQLLELAQRDDTELFVAGKIGTPNLNDLLKLAPNVRFLGKLERFDALACMRDAHLVSLLYDPSIPVNRVAAPNKLYEAMCVGTPVLVSSGMSLAAEVRAHGLGWVVEYGDRQALQSVLTDCRNATKMQELRERCRRYYREHSAYAEEMQQYEQFYRRLCDGSKSGTLLPSDGSLDPLMRERKPKAAAVGNTRPAAAAPSIS